MPDQDKDTAAATANVSSFRLRPQTKQQLDDLRRYGRNSTIIMIAIDRMWHEEQRSAAFHSKPSPVQSEQ